VATASDLVSSVSIVQPVQQMRGRNWRARNARVRNGRYWRRHRDRDVNVGVGGLFLGTVATIIIADAIHDGRARDDDMQACADRYRSFNWRSGTYIGYDGRSYICPYLR
jgi:hypothetical protein